MMDCSPEYEEAFRIEITDVAKEIMAILRKKDWPLSSEALALATALTTVLCLEVEQRNGDSLMNNILGWVRENVEYYKVNGKL